MSANPTGGMGDITARLADHALALEWGDLAEPVRGAARIFLHDTLCVGAAGVGAAKADAVLAVVQSWGEGSQAAVLGRPGLRLPPASAAFVNAFQIHGQEFDCVHEGAVLHPLSTIVAALKADADRSPVTGVDFLSGMVAGVDVAVALGLAATSPVRFFRPATAGVFGSVAALARMRRLDRATTLDALGYALAFASGTMQAHVEGKPALPLQVAAAARSALVAVDLAIAGLKGPQDSVGGAFGYLALLEASSDTERVLAELAGRRRITELSCKPFPTGRAAHGGLEALRLLMASPGVTAASLDGLVFRAPPLIARLVGRPAKPSMDIAYARLCLPWLAAVALTRSKVGLGDFTPERLGDADILALAARVTVEDDGSTDPAAFGPLIATARLRDGSVKTLRVDTAPGSPAAPLTIDQHFAKARACLDFAGLPPALHDDLWRAVEALDRAPDVSADLPL